MKQERFRQRAENGKLNETVKNLEVELATLRTNYKGFTIIEETLQEKIRKLKRKNGELTNLLLQYDRTDQHQKKKISRLQVKKDDKELEL